MSIYLLNLYYLLLLIATFVAIFFSFVRSTLKKVDMGLIGYLTLSCVLNFVNYFYSKDLIIQNVMSCYSVLLIPSVFFARFFKWIFLATINILFIILILIGFNFGNYLAIYSIFLVIFAIYHCLFQRNFDYLIHNLFLISAFVFTLLFLLFSEYQQFWITSHYKYNVFIFYSFFLYIFYIFIIFKYAKS